MNRGHGSGGSEYVQCGVESEQGSTAVFCYLITNDRTRMALMLEDKWHAV